MTECHDQPDGSSSGRQRLEVVRGGARAPTLIKEIDAFESFKGPLGVAWCKNPEP